MERNITGSVLWKSGPIVVPTVRALDAAAGSYEVLISTSHRDRDGDSVKQQSMGTKNYVRNKAPIFWGHQSSGLPIGKTVKIRREKLADGAYGTWATPLLATEIPEYPLPRIVRDLLALDVCGPSSVGFLVHDAKELPDALLTPAEIEARKSGQGVYGRLITLSELVEWSFVGIPANPNVDITQAGLDRERVETIHEVAAKHLSGGALKDFMRPLPYKESVYIGCHTVDEVPDRVRAFMGAAVPAEPVDDEGFDLTAKAADPEPEPVPDDEPPVAPIAKAIEAKLTGAEAGAMEARLGMLAGSLGALIARAEIVVSRVDAACARMEACCAEMEAEDDPAEPTDGMTMASFVAEITKRLDTLAARVEDSHAEFYLAHLNSKSTAPRDTRSDPAPRVEAAKPPAVVAAPKHAPIDPMAFVPQIAKAVSGEVSKQVEAALYKARGGVEIP